MKPRFLTPWPCALLLGAGLILFGFAAASPEPWQYRLTEGSTVTDDCLNCDRIIISWPLRGTCQFRWLAEDPLFVHYAVEDIAFTAGAPPGPHYRVTGRGTYQVGGEVALRQEMILELEIDDGFMRRSCMLTNSSPAVNRFWPMLEISLEESPKTDASFYRLDLASAPLREIWVSTSAGLTSGNALPPTNLISGGDLISDIGHVVKRNEALTRHLGLMPGVPDLGLDALDVLPGGEIAFSLGQDVASESLGPLGHGDLLSQLGSVLRRNTDLLQPFSPEPPVADMGLDAVHLRGDGAVWFSLENDVFSEKLGLTLRRGDLLSSAGRILKSNAELLARFEPADPKQDYGLDALYVWPSGEIWFSVETDFAGPHSAQFAAGDLLSDQGYVVFRNLELTRAFAPLEDLADFGLDTLFVVTDATPPAPSPRITSLNVNPQTGAVSIQADGGGRVFQLEGASDVLGPWLLLGPITPDLAWEWVPPRPGPVSAFFRLRQW